MLALFVAAAQLAPADSVYTDDAKLYGNVVAISVTTITLRQGCADGNDRTFRWDDVRYIVFDSNCSGSSSPGNGFGRNDEPGACRDKARFWRIDFNHASDEPFIYGRSIQLMDSRLRIETVADGTVTGPRSRLRSITPMTKCASDPLLKRGSLPRDYQ